jgi:hypothetical protein
MYPTLIGWKLQSTDEIIFKAVSKWWDKLVHVIKYKNNEYANSLRSGYDRS